MTGTVFSKVDFTLAGLVDRIHRGEIGLPDIQRPFVWKNAKVRNLLDSMYRGYPVGYLLFWETGAEDGVKSIGEGEKQSVPKLLIVDGQQRLTSLYAVLQGVKVVRQNYGTELIEIAFNPLDEKFEVTDAAIKRDPTFIPNVSVVWAAGADLFEIAGDFIKSLQESRELSQDDVKKIRGSITKLANLKSFPLTALQLAPSVSEEQVSEIFVRINSEGKKLNQSDFILTLMSVFWDKGRMQLETFCRNARRPTAGTPSPFNHFIQPDPDQLLRVSIAVGFRRARLATVYSILRGKDFETDKFSAERREQQFAILKDAQARVLNLQDWHDFLKALVRAGYRSGRMVSSQTALIFSYSLYLLGRTEFQVPEPALRRAIARWYFMAALTGRYTTSPETRMEADLARLRGLSASGEFLSTLREICGSVLTSDYWTITLPNELATSAARSPSLFAYFAALNILEARVLFSDHKVPELMDPALNSHRTSLERHHLFPKAYLKSIGITDNRDINQIANFAVVEWGDNGRISDSAPSEYLPVLSRRFSDLEIAKMARLHALPSGWEAMGYPEFLRRRRELMAEIIHEAYLRLNEEGESLPPSGSQPFDLFQLVQTGETASTEFKSTLRINLHTGEKDVRMELGVLKTLAGFINGHGGTLILGVKDDGSPVGIESDKFADEDKMNLHLVNLIKDRIGPQHSLYIHPHFDDYDGARVLVVECQKGRAPVFVEDGAVERFFVRSGAATIELSASQTQDYIKHRFP